MKKNSDKEESVAIMRFLCPRKQEKKRRHHEIWNIMHSAVFS